MIESDRFLCFRKLAILHIQYKSTTCEYFCAAYMKYTKCAYIDLASEPESFKTKHASLTKFFYLVQLNCDTTFSRVYFLGKRGENTGQCFSKYHTRNHAEYECNRKEIN